jgi:hypothetical protein
MLNDPWMLELREAVAAMKDRELRSLSADERFLLARYHGLQWAYLRREGPNKAKSRGIATSLSQLVDRIGRDPRKADLTVAEYVSLARRLHDRIGRGAWYRPFDVEAEIEIESAVPA